MNQRLLQRNSATANIARLNAIAQARDAFSGENGERAEGREERRLQGDGRAALAGDLDGVEQPRDETREREEEKRVHAVDRERPREEAGGHARTRAGFVHRGVEGRERDERPPGHEHGVGGRPGFC